MGDVVVQNTSLGTSVTVPAGNILRLTDGVSGVANLYRDANSDLEVFTNSATGAATIAFYANQSGAANIEVYGLNGIKITALNQTLIAGTNLFDLGLTKGAYVVRVTFGDNHYSSKLLIMKDFKDNAGLTFRAYKPTSNLTISKSKALGVTELNYFAANKITMKAISGVYSTSVIDSPTESKTINFQFDVCSDYDGKNYATVKIGNQLWMAENLATEKYQNGEVIANVTNTEEWGGLATAAWCDFDNDPSSGAKYGHFYNWYAVNDNRKIAPAGWHVATDADWNALSAYLISMGYNYDGSTGSNKLSKAIAANTDWATSGNPGAIGNDLTRNNAAGFNGLPAGIRNINGDFVFRKSNDMKTYWWSATSATFDTANTCSVNYYWSSWYRYASPKGSGYSVRCVKD